MDGKVVLVTGASSGIGAALSRQLVEAGATVVAAARRQELLDELGAAASFRVDLSDPADALRLADEAVGRFGQVDVLVNNAGVRLDSPAVDASLEEIDQSFQVNVLSPMVLAGRLVPGMVERGEGVVANVLAPQVSPGRRGMGAYAASKAALESFTQTLRQEVGGGKGVAVFGFDPGWVKTGLAPDGSDEPEDAASRLLAAIARGRSSRDILS
jgi:NAD(P)-dependent dehydrogenase (short-subunit alcohol dehydrogenase family)